MILYGSDLSPFVQRVKIQTAVKGVALEMKPPPGGLKSADFLAINPMGKVPCLVTDTGLNLPESEVIVEFLEETFPKPALRPRKPEERAKIRLISRVADIYLDPALGKLFGVLRPGADPEAKAAAIQAIDAALGHLEAVVSGRKNAAGAKFTTADCALAPMLFFVARLMPVVGVKAPFKTKPKLARYWRGREKHEATAKAIAEMGAELKARFGM